MVVVHVCAKMLACSYFASCVSKVFNPDYTITNGVYLGSFPLLKFTGTFTWAEEKARLEFTFDQVRDTPPQNLLGECFGVPVTPVSLHRAVSSKYELAVYHWWPPFFVSNAVGVGCLKKTYCSCFAPPE